MGLVRVLFTFMLITGFVSANYISGDIYINGEGKASFYVETDTDISIDGLEFSGNELRGNTDLLTFKDKDVWGFNLDLAEYETILLDIHLPKNVDKVFSTSGVDNLFDIEEKIVSLIDNNKKLNFEVRYSTKDDFSYGFLFWIFGFSIAIFLLIFYFYKKGSVKRKLSRVFPFINNNEKNIINLLINQHLRQKEVREKLGIPKASFTRYILNLEKKGIILREGEGKNKILKVK